MATQDIAAAIKRAEAVFLRRPEMGLHDDSPASARWDGGTRIVTSHANGTEVASDMPSELGGTGDLITPGWLFRAGLAACATTSIAMTAAAKGIELSRLEVRVTSRSDSRGLLGMSEPTGTPVPANPRDFELVVQIAAPGVAPERLHGLIDHGLRCSPIPNALQAATPLRVRVETGNG